MIEITVIGFLTALAFGIIMWKVNLSFFAKYHWQTDIAVSAGLATLFFGTFKGMVIALVAGIFMSIFLMLARLVLKPL